MNKLPSILRPLVFLLALALILALFSGTLFSGSAKNVLQYSDVLDLFHAEQVESFVLQGNTLQMQLRQEEGAEERGTVTAQIGDVELFHADLDALIAQQKQNGVLLSYNYLPAVTPWYKTILPYLAGGIVLLLIFFLIMGRANGGPASMAQFTHANTRFGSPGKTPVTFDDVAGADEEKAELQQIVDFLRNPKRFAEMGAHVPKGVLLVGPPGTGKTLLARAVAGEAGVSFLSISGSDFVELYVGVGASRVRDLFKKAKERSPSIVFIDEIDAIGRARGRNSGYGTNEERENTLNQLLTEMDGFGNNSGVIILAATNRAEILDRALMRAGRFDRQIQVELPDIKEREAIFNVHLRPLKLEEGFDRSFLAKLTPGFSGADIANVCNEAALTAARKGKQAVGKQDFQDAVDRIVGGLERKNRIMTQEERRAVACHEAGHAAVSWLLEFGNPLVKVTIVPRGKALGAAWYQPEERQLTTKGHLLDDICSLLGGRAAEDITYGRVGTGALNDLERANKQAYAMVTYYGMSDKLPNVCYYDSTGQQDYAFRAPYSESRAKIIDDEVSAIIDSQYARAKDILSRNADKHRQLAELLLEREVIFTEDVEKIFGPRPWKKRDEELAAEELAEAKQEAEAALPEAEAKPQIEAKPNGEVSAD